ncbi:MAG TPA: hypothetical protein VJ144_04440, partial [Candidatus Polarisedimenticolia bacterium]|nr:hypothetical protein [Candidatus Polarisedimenticolia bacterium]
MTPDRDESKEPQISDSYTLVLLVVILAIAAVLRFWKINECGLSMWDEYAYVRSGRFIATFGREGGPHAPDVAPALFPLWLG